MASKKTHFIVTLTAEQFTTVRRAVWARDEMLRTYALEIGDFDSTGAREQLRVKRNTTNSASAALRRADTPDCDCHSNSASECEVDWHGHCEACNDTGILIMRPEHDDDRDHIEKCDDCNRYESDDDAVEALNKLLYNCGR